MTNYYPRYFDPEKISQALDFYGKVHDVDLEEDDQKEIVRLISERLKVGVGYELSDEDEKVIEKVKELFGDLDFEEDFLKSIKKHNYCLERYKEGEIDYEKISENIKGIFKEVDEYQKELDEYFEHDEWKLKVDKNGVRIYERKKPGSSFLMIKGTTEFKSSMGYKDISRKIYDYSIAGVEPEDRAVFSSVDIDNIYSNSVYEVDKNNDIFHLKQNSGSRIVSNRDFIFTRRYYLDTKKKIGYAFGTSADIVKERKEWFPVDKKAVRAIASGFAYQITQKKKGLIQLSYAMHCDPGGWVPSFLYNLRVKQKGYSVVRYSKFFQSLEKKMKKDEDEESEEEEEEEEVKKSSSTSEDESDDSEDDSEES